MKSSVRNAKKLELDVIVSAIQGDTMAINAVCAHYRPYLRALATEELFDASGQSHFIYNEDIFFQLESKLMTSILKYKI